jgi:hypothetical protein
VPEGARTHRFVPFVRDVAGSPVLLSEIWRGIDQRPVDPDPGRTIRCT